MSSDTDSSTDSASSEDYKKRKSSKKRKHQKSEKKHKKHKKEKRHKKSKRSRRVEETFPEVQSIAPPSQVVSNDDMDAFGPALPPHLLQRQTEQPKLYGPTMPKGLPEQTEMEQAKPNDAASPAEEQQEADDDAGTYGPMPVSTSAAGMSATQIELEQRALQLKLAAIDGMSMTNVDQKEREEWMLELPEVGLKSGLAALSNMKRGFYQGKERPDFSDRSSWTKTPEDAAKPTKPSTSKSAAETLKSEAEARYERQRDEEQERMAKKHKKEHKRNESLVELHQKKLRKEQRQREKELAASGEKPERRPFSRDVDLKLNKIDKNQTKQIVDKAKILNTKFSTGHSKYL